jgi:hypothetical protein
MRFGLTGCAVPALIWETEGVNIVVATYAHATR